MHVVCLLRVVEEGGHVEVTRLSCGDEFMLVDVHGSRTYSGPGRVWDLPHMCVTALFVDGACVMLIEQVRYDLGLRAEVMMVTESGVVPLGAYGTDTVEIRP